MLTNIQNVMEDLSMIGINLNKSFSNVDKSFNNVDIVLPDTKKSLMNIDRFAISSLNI